MSLSCSEIYSSINYLGGVGMLFIINVDVPQHIFYSLFVYNNRHPLTSRFLPHACYSVSSLLYIVYPYLL